MQIEKFFDGARLFGTLACMDTSQFISLRRRLCKIGYRSEIKWQRDLQPCDNSLDFRSETIWVILNSGMKEQIARLISSRIYEAIASGIDISSVFGHKGKVAAIKMVWEKSGDLFEAYTLAVDKIGYLKTIPYIGSITCWHLAKNLGQDCAKPDRHLVRIASQYGMTTNEMCTKLSHETGEKVSVVDIIIWRACNLGLL